MMNDGLSHLEALWTDCLDTELGSMVAVADEAGLYLLAFDDGQGFATEIEKLQISFKCSVTSGHNLVIQSIFSELKAYFAGELKIFTTPIHLLGSPFQQLACSSLGKIPYGETRSYVFQAQAIGRATAFRALAQANRRNQLAIVLPCHRVIYHNGNLGGYRWGMARKHWLLTHEEKYVNRS